jgi:hypothetical protein
LELNIIVNQWLHMRKRHAEKRRALDAWAMRLLEIVEDREAVGNVVRIERQ